MRRTRNSPGGEIAVVIPAYKVSNQLSFVLASIPSYIGHIFVVDDACPDNSGLKAESESKDARVRFIYLPKNQGVGGAVIAGYLAALKHSEIRIIVKIDGDGQMDPGLIEDFCKPIIGGEASYTKGNRFSSIESLHTMPKHRIFGNLVLSFFAKASSGYWNIFDCNNGYTAIGVSTLKKLPLNKISKRYFFESDMLFRLQLVGAVVRDVPIKAVYRDEKSNLSIFKNIFEFTYKNIRNLIKRIIYDYFLRDFSMASVNLIIGTTFLFFGLVFALKDWMGSTKSHIPTNTGSLVLVILLITTGTQLLMSFLSHDLQKYPKE